MSIRVSLALALFAACNSRTEAVTQDPPPQLAPPRFELTDDIPHCSTATAQLRYATQCKLRAWRASDAEADALRARAVLAFQSVRAYFPGERALGAEAAFRAGELLRAARDDAGARGEFDAVLAAGVRTSFTARARLELGDIERRAHRPQLALDQYLAVLMDIRVDAKWRDAAGLSAGRAYEDLERADDARRLFQLVAEHGQDPLDRVRGFDAWAMTFVAIDDLEAAAGVVAVCRGALAGRAEEETELGLRVRSALERMRCIGAIELAVAHRRGTRSTVDKE